MIMYPELSKNSELTQGVRTHTAQNLLLLELHKLHTFPFNLRNISGAILLLQMWKLRLKEVKWSA